jgi:hypothetical protein
VQLVASAETAAAVGMAAEVEVAAATGAEEGVELTSFEDIAAAEIVWDVADITAMEYGTALRPEAAGLAATPALAAIELAAAADGMEHDAQGSITADQPTLQQKPMVDVTCDSLLDVMLGTPLAGLRHAIELDPLSAEQQEGRALGEQAFSRGVKAVQQVMKDGAALQTLLDRKHPPPPVVALPTISASSSKHRRVTRGMRLLNSLKVSETGGALEQHSMELQHNLLSVSY